MIDIKKLRGSARALPVRKRTVLELIDELEAAREELEKYKAFVRAIPKFNHYPQCRLSWSMTDHDSICTCEITKLRQAFAALGDV